MSLNDIKKDYEKKRDAFYKAQEKFNKLTKIEEAKEMVKQIGKCFMYHNCYSCPSKASDYWYHYKKIISVKDNQYQFIGVSKDKYGAIKIELFYESSYALTGWTACSPIVFKRNYDKLLKEVKELSE